MTAQAEIAQGELRTQLWEQVRLYRRRQRFAQTYPSQKAWTIWSGAARTKGSESFVWSWGPVTSQIE